MAIVDKALELSLAQAVTATAKSTGTIDLGPNSWAGNSKGVDEPVIPIEVTIDTAFTAGGAGTLAIALRSSPNADMSSPTVHRSAGPYALAALVPGFRLSLEIPWDTGRYVDVHYTVATGPMTAGKINAQVVTGRQTQ